MVACLVEVWISNRVGIPAVVEKDSREKHVEHPVRLMWDGSGSRYTIHLKGVVGERWNE